MYPLNLEFPIVYLSTLANNFLSLSLSLHFHISHTNDAITSFLLDYTNNPYIICICYFNKLVFLRAFIRVILILSQELRYAFTLYINVKVQLIFKLLNHCTLLLQIRC